MGSGHTKKRSELSYKISETTMRHRSTALVVALVGTEHSDEWWSGPNKAFDGQSPAFRWIKDPESVYNYLMNFYDR